jgi:hypothetical protein
MENYMITEVWGIDKREPGSGINRVCPREIFKVPIQVAACKLEKRVFYSQYKKLASVPHHLHPTHTLIEIE